MRKIIACVVIAVMLVVQVMPQKAEANPAVLAAGLVPPAAAVLVAAGVTVGAEAGLDALARWWYSEAGQDVRDQLAADWSAAVEGVMNVSSTVWESVRTWVQSKFVVGESSILVANQSGNRVYSGTDGGYYYTYYEVGSDGYVRWGVIWSLTSSTEAYNFGLASKYNVSSNVLYVSNGKVRWYTTYTLNGTLYTIDSEVGTYVAPSVSYTGADVLSNPTWDFANSEGKRLVGVPPVLGDLAGKTYSDVIIGDTSVPGDTTVPGETTVLDSILSKISSIADALTTGIIGDISSVQFPSIPSITTKFPFSLPWDFARMIGLMYSSPECPRINMSLGPPFNAQLDIDLAQILPESLMSKYRLLELIAFGLGLVLVTRRLLGGAE